MSRGLQPRTRPRTCKSARQRHSASSINIQFLLGVNISLSNVHEPSSSSSSSPLSRVHEHQTQTPAPVTPIPLMLRSYSAVKFSASPKVDFSRIVGIPLALQHCIWLLSQRALGCLIVPATDLDSFIARIGSLFVLRYFLLAERNPYSFLFSCNPPPLFLNTERARSHSIECVEYHTLLVLNRHSNFGTQYQKTPHTLAHWISHCASQP